MTDATGGKDRAALIRRCFDAYRTKQRELLDDMFTDDFTFTSPYDDGIDKATYFERCWPNSVLIKENVIEKLFVEGDEAFVQYRCLAANGHEFRNTEFFKFSGDRIRSVDVYFGASYRDGRFEAKAIAG